MASLKHAGKAVLITGCSTGIGRTTAALLCARGFTVYATARQVESMTELEQLGCRLLPLDVTDEDSMRQAVQAVERDCGAVSVLINNAGYSQSGAVEEVTMEQLRRQFETNVFGLVRLTQLVLPKMRAQGWGRIVNLSSIAGKMVFPGGGAYHATKHAVEALSDALRFEVRGFGIDVVLVEPGFIHTEFLATAVGSVEAQRVSEGPYAGFTAAVVQTTKDAYSKPPYIWIGGESDAVAKVVAKALDARRPRARYSVTTSGWLLIGLRWLLPDCLWDAWLRRVYPQPGLLR